MTHRVLPLLSPAWQQTNSHHREALWERTSQRKFTLFSPLGLDGLSTLGTLDIPSGVGPTSLGQGEGTHKTASNLTTPVFTLFYVFFPFNSSQVVLKRPTFGLEKHIFANNISRSRVMLLEATPVLLPPAEGGYSCEQADLPCSASPLRGKRHFHMESKEPTHSLLPSSQISHSRPWRLWEAEEGSAARHLHVPMARREKWPKIAQSLLPSPVRPGFYSYPIYPWDKCLLHSPQSLQAGS